MYDSRTDADVLRSKRGPGWNGDLTHNPYLARCWREMGEGDRIEWGTPRSRVMATKRAERVAIAEGLAEYLAAQPAAGACGVCGETNDPACTTGC